MFTGKFQPRRVCRLHWNRKHKKRDRYHGKFGRWGEYVGRWVFGRRFESDYTFDRRPTHTETGYGVAYEKRPDKDLIDW